MNVLVAIVISVLLVTICAHSYLPKWSSSVQHLSVYSGDSKRCNGFQIVVMAVMRLDVVSYHYFGGRGKRGGSQTHIIKGDICSG